MFLGPAKSMASQIDRAQSTSIATRSSIDFHLPDVETARGVENVAAGLVIRVGWTQVAT
jgi:hypothetical protein